MPSIGRIRFTNHLGDSIEFSDETGVLLGDSELFSYERKYSSTENVYESLTVEPRSIPVNILFTGDVPNARSKFYEVVDLDALEKKPGTLKIGDCYMEGIFIDSSNRNFEAKGEMIRKMQFLSQKPVWRRDMVKLFDVSETKPAIINESYKSAPATIELWGAAEDATISIGGFTYQVYHEIPEGGKLVIDGFKKTAKVIDADGNETNVLDDRQGLQVKGSGYYLFEEVPRGHNEVTWNPHNKLRITIHETRMEVKLNE